MRYRRPGPQYTMWIIPDNTITINGRNEFRKGIAARFKGNPPKFDSEKEAQALLDWEIKTGKIDFDDSKLHKQRLKEIDKLIIRTLETHKTFIPEFDKKAIGRIMRDIDQYEEMKKDGIPVCDYCEPPRGFELPQDLINHQFEEHREEMKKKLEENDQIRVTDGTATEVGQVG